MQTFPTSGSLTIAAGDNLVVNVPGNFFRVLQASGSLSVSFDDDGQAAFVEPGLAIYRDKPFVSLRLTNDGAAAISGVMVAIGFGRYDDNRLQYGGGVAIRGGGSGFTDAVVSVGGTATLILAANTSRSSGVIRSGGADLWLGPDASVTATGPATIPAGGALTIGHVAAVYAIRSGGAADAGVYAETV